MKVWLVMIGWDYEGEIVDSVWDDHNRALMRVEKLRDLRAEGDISGDTFRCDDWVINQPETHLESLR